MILQFETISLDKQKAYNTSYFSKCSQKASDYSFINLFGWADVYGLCWAWTDNLVWIKQTYPKPVYWAPIGDWKSVHWEPVIEELFSHQAEFIRVPESLSLLWTDMFLDRVKVEESRESWDYLYSAADLKTLSGNRYHKKKNLLNQFKKKYDYTYLPFRGDIVQQALGMQEDWCVWRDCESSETLSAENRVIAKILESWNQLEGIMGGAVTIDSQMAAYTIAEQLSDDTLLIHFEKGSNEYKGSYQAINQMFLSNLNHDFLWVNREQDLGDEGLRKAKLSYHPTDFLKKYRVLF